MPGVRRKFEALVYCKRRDDLTAETPLRGGLQTRLAKSKARAYVPAFPFLGCQELVLRKFAKRRGEDQT